MSKKNSKKNAVKLQAEVSKTRAKEYLQARSKVRQRDFLEDPAESHSSTRTEKSFEPLAEQLLVEHRENHAEEHEMKQLEEQLYNFLDESPAGSSKQNNNKSSFLSLLRNVFNKFDSNGDGNLTARELCEVLRFLGQDLSTVDVKSMALNYAPNGLIDFDAFLELISKEQFPVQMFKNLDEMKEAFDIFDIKKTGFITTEELREVMTDIGEDVSDMVIEAMIAEADSDGDGKVTFEDFIRVMPN